jgi:hypothetical protein
MGNRKGGLFLMAIVNEKIEIRAPGNGAGANGNYRFIIDGSNNFNKQKRKSDAWDTIETDEF